MAKAYITLFVQSVIVFCIIIKATSLDEHTCFSGSPPLCFILFYCLLLLQLWTSG